MALTCLVLCVTGLEHSDVIGLRVYLERGSWVVIRRVINKNPK